MAPDLTQKISEICALSVAEKLEVIAVIWASIPPESSPPGLPDMAELKRRLDEDEADPEDTLSWEEVMDEVRRSS